MDHSPERAASEAAIAAQSDGADAIPLTNDADAVAGIFSDDWVSVAADGYTTKDMLIDWIRSGRLAHHSMRTVGERRIRVSGGTAIVTARRASTGTWEGSDYVADEWMTDVLERRDDRWVCILTHKTPAP